MARVTLVPGIDTRRGSDRIGTRYRGILVGDEKIWWNVADDHVDIATLYYNFEYGSVDCTNVKV